MNVQSKLIYGDTAGVADLDRSEDLKALLKPDCAAAVWHRQPEPNFQSWISALEPERLPDGRVIVQRLAIREALTALCDSAQTPQCPERVWFIDDATALSDIFAEITGARYMRLRLQAVTTNACRKFHVDAITARLVCTYRGTGTQYGISYDGADPKQISTVPTGSPILLRGTLWPPNHRSGLLHRSPPIEGTNETRLVLVLDPVFDPEDAI